MTSGTSVTHPTYDWVVRPDPLGPDPTIIGSDIQINSAINPAHPTFGPLQGYVWCHIDPVSVPAGATITSIDVTLTAVESSSTSASPGVAQSPLVYFAPESAITAGGTPFPNYGTIGSGGPGDLAATTSPQAITYDGLLYPSQSGGGGISDFAGWVAALGATDPLSMLVTAQVVADGQYLEYDAPWVFTIYWDLGGPSVLPPLRRYPRSDGLGSSGVRRAYPPSPSTQASNRRAGGYI